MHLISACTSELDTALQEEQAKVSPRRNQSQKPTRSPLPNTAVVVFTEITVREDSGLSSSYSVSCNCQCTLTEATSASDLREHHILWAKTALKARFLSGGRAPRSPGGDVGVCRKGRRRHASGPRLCRPRLRWPLSDPGPARHDEARRPESR
eukprot:3050647-Rhodomonas_salina.2